MSAVKLSGFKELDQIFERMPDTLRDAIIRVVEQNADDFERRIAAVVPRDDKMGEHLAETLKVEPGKYQSEITRVVSIGDLYDSYVGHLEWGHFSRDKQGKHIPARPFWYPTWRLNKRRYKARVSRVIRDEIKRLARSGYT